MPEETRQVNFTIVPAEPEHEERTYANFCAVAHTPFDFTLTFCEVMPLSEKDIADAQKEHIIRAPVRARIVVPVQILPSLITALQEQYRSFSEPQPGIGWNKGPVH